MWCDGLRCVSGIADQEGKGTKRKRPGCGAACAAQSCDEVCGVFEEGEEGGRYPLGFNIAQNRDLAEPYFHLHGFGVEDDGFAEGGEQVVDCV